MNDWARARRNRHGQIGNHPGQPRRGHGGGSCLTVGGGPCGHASGPCPPAEGTGGRWCRRPAGLGFLLNTGVPFRYPDGAGALTCAVRSIARARREPPEAIPWCALLKRRARFVSGIVVVATAWPNDSKQQRQLSEPQACRSRIFPNASRQTGPNGRDFSGVTCAAPLFC